MSARSRALSNRGNVALVAALATAGFLVASLATADQWAPLHTWYAAGVATLATISLLCRALAALTHPEGESPQVSHPPVTPSDTPREVQ